MEREKVKRRSIIIFAILAAASFFVGTYLLYFPLKSGLDREAVDDFAEKYLAECSELHVSLMNYQKLIQTKSTPRARFDFTQGYKEKTGFDFFVFEGSDLIIWSSNQVPLDLAQLFTAGKKIFYFKNAWYQVDYMRKGRLIYLACFLIKTDYAHENEDLVNRFNDQLGLGFKGDLRFDHSGYSIFDKKGNYLFSIAPIAYDEWGKKSELVIFFAFLLGIYFLITTLLGILSLGVMARSPFVIILPLVLILLRWLSLKYGWLGMFDRFDLFNPELYASSRFAPSLGDLIINTLLVFYVIYFLIQNSPFWFSGHRKKSRIVFLLVPLFLLSFYGAFKINELIYSLVYDSQIAFDLERLFHLSVYSVLSISLIGAAFYSYLRFVQFLIQAFKSCRFEWNRLAFIWALSSGVYLFFDQNESNHSLTTSLWPILLSGYLLWFEFNQKEYKFVHILSILAFIAFYSAYILEDYSSNNERNLRMQYAENISAEKDIITEIDYNTVQGLLIRDSVLAPALEGNQPIAALMDTLESNYFSRLSESYDLTFYLFDSAGAQVLDENGYQSKNYIDLQEMIARSGLESAINENIYFIDDYSEKLIYIARLPLIWDDQVKGYLFTAFRSKKFPADIGLPSLLLDNRTTSLDQFEDYSIAKYVEDTLVLRKGGYVYSTEAPEVFKVSRGNIDYDGFSHYIYNADSRHKTVVSKRHLSPFSLFTSFSYLLIYFGALLLIPAGLRQMHRAKRPKSIKLNVKIQVVLIGVTTLMLVFFAVAAGTFVVRQFKENNRGLIHEKLISVGTEFESKLKNETDLNSEMASRLEYLLRKFSGVFQADINLFDFSGNLLASSQPKIYDKGLISAKMNPLAYEQIYYAKKSEFIHDEKIGDLTFLSAYMPFVNQKGEQLAYINVQYISRQDQLERQISNFLLTIVDIMVLMLVISTVLIVSVSNQLTRPLKYIQESLKHIQIGAKSRPIDYEGDDEIGDLVEQYNLKLEELQISAEALAKSERESAWREMAKQVAHEIKNPLTPMKLSIQHLKRSVKFEDEESREKLRAVSNSLIEQIDALSQIANEFSNFAQMPKAMESELNLADLLRNAVGVFGGNDSYFLELDVPLKFAGIWGDKDQLLRVFNNLIKNSIQSIPKGRKGKILVRLNDKKEYYEIVVKDDGVGMSKEAQKRIFVPYFTTKSTGTGLGLAMAKQIIEGMNGVIDFTSVEDEGTTFYIRIPKYLGSI